MWVYLKKKELKDMRNKYTKAELVALVQVKLIGLGMKITQQDITKI